MNITSYQGEQLLQSETLEAIKKEADLLLQNKDVAAAWQGSRHIKKELAGLPGDKVTTVLNDYRALTANLKALALPLLDWDEVKSLLSNNLALLDPKYLPALGAALPAWLATIAEDQQAGKRDELLKLLPPTSPLRANLVAGKAPERASRESAINPVQALAMGSDVLFDKAEAAELASHIKKVNDIGAAPMLARGASMGAAENIFNLSHSPADKESFARRANALIASRLRDVRTRAELREYLGRPFKVGGLGLGADILDKAGALIEDEYNKLHSNTPPAPVPAKVEPVLVSPAPKAEPKPEIIKIKPVSEIFAPTPPPAAPPRVMRPLRAAPANDKPRVEDIKSSSRTVSAVDELRLLTLADWRKYGASAEATNNILQKVQLLGQESVGSKVQGIKMFRQSQLFQQYIALGRASLAQGKKLAEVLADKTVNPGQMTEDEFFAIALLNGKLK